MIVNSKKRAPLVNRAVNEVMRLVCELLNAFNYLIQPQGGWLLVWHGFALLQTPAERAAETPGRAPECKLCQ